MLRVPGRDVPIKGPFENEAIFNGGILRRLGTVSSMIESYSETLRELFNEALKNQRIVLTHSDLELKNVMVDRIGDNEDFIGRLEITILDWDNADQYPDY
jgi:hypothetical protein